MCFSEKFQKIRRGAAAALPQPMEYRPISKSRCFTIFFPRTCGYTLPVTQGKCIWIARANISGRLLPPDQKREPPRLPGSQAHRRTGRPFFTRTQTPDISHGRFDKRTISVYLGKEMGWSGESGHECGSSAAAPFRIRQGNDSRIFSFREKLLAPSMSGWNHWKTSARQLFPTVIPPQSPPCMGLGRAGFFRSTFSRARYAATKPSDPSTFPSVK